MSLNTDLNRAAKRRQAVERRAQEALTLVDPDLARPIAALISALREETSAARRYARARDIETPPTDLATPATPEEGHTFHVAVWCRGSSGVLDGPKSDADWWGAPLEVRVRAWNLFDALELAHMEPLQNWHPVSGERVSTS